MADNRLFLVHKHTRKCVCIGKTLGSYVPYTPDNMDIDPFYNSLADDIVRKCLDEEEALSYYVVTEDDGDLITSNNGERYFLGKEK